MLDSPKPSQLTITLEASTVKCAIRFWYWFAGTYVDIIRVQAINGGEIYTVGEVKGYNQWTKAEMSIPEKVTEFEVS